MTDRLVIVVFALAGCAPSLGDGDDAAARTLVYDEGGLPSYAGQALVQNSCGNGAFCHAAAIAPEARYGAPLGADFDLRLATGQGDLERLARDQRHVTSRAGSIYEQVVRGTMPPYQPARDEVLSGAPRFHFRGGAPLPDLTSAEGRELLRVWLASGSPLVEAIGAPWPGTVGMIEPCEGGQIDFESCFAATQPPLLPEWPDIYERLISRRCASSACHDSDEPEGALDLSSLDGAWRQLVAVAATGEACAGRELTRVVPGDPGASLLVQKLLASDGSTPVACGTAMPIGGSPLPRQWIEAVSQWITACATLCPGPECAAPIGCRDCAASETGTCSGGVDDDCDGRVDCEDADCATDTVACTMCKAVEAGSCNNGLDDDCDERPDCADSECTADPSCSSCTASEAGLCRNGYNDDCDADGVDCADADCMGDAACAMMCVPAAMLEVGRCADGTDSDCDGRTDCADLDCATDAACCTPSAGTEAAACSGGEDDDCDGAVDCADPDCTGTAVCCVPTVMRESGVCSDGRDNDCDGTTDCADADCRRMPGC